LVSPKRFPAIRVRIVGWTSRSSLGRPAVDRVRERRGGAGSPVAGRRGTAGAGLPAL